MIEYRREGLLPEKPHSVFKPEGQLAYEHVFTRDGFDGPFSILYMREQVQFMGEGVSVDALWDVSVGRDPQALRRRHLRSFERAENKEMSRTEEHFLARQVLLSNADLTIGTCKFESAAETLFSNGDADELFYIHEGGGVLESAYGELEFRQGDYLCVPKSVIHRIRVKGPQYWFWVECKSGLRVPKQYRNTIGQLRMDAPYTHRDFKSPVLKVATQRRASSSFELTTKRRGRFSKHQLSADPFDSLGWDGTVYPFTFHISRFSPRSGQYHLPPTVHGTFATAGSLICSFVPRMVDFGEGAIPCPYPHSNVDVDEVIFYCDGDFTSRRGLQAGSISLHPAGIPHGPHPGAYEASIGAKEAHETAVMIDTFDPLRIHAAAETIEDAHYDESWV